MQTSCELYIDIECVTEPAAIPVNPRWFASANGLAAIYRNGNSYIYNWIIVKSGRNFVVVRGLYVASVYIAPSESNDAFHETLDELGNIIHSADGNFIITFL